MMNKLTIYVLPKVGGARKKKKYNYHLGYMVLPFLYLIVILCLTTIEPINKSKSIVKVSRMDSYSELSITDDVKRQIILEKYNLTNEQFNVVCAIVLAEAEYNSYEDAYAVINTIYNRTKALSWIKSIENKFGTGKGTSLYYQAISPRQFTVYESGSYKKYLNKTDFVGYDAIIDFLFTEKILHNYVSFRSHNIKVSGSESFSAKGNNYFNAI